MQLGTLHVDEIRSPSAERIAIIYILQGACEQRSDGVCHLTASSQMLTWDGSTKQAANHAILLENLQLTRSNGNAATPSGARSHSDTHFQPGDEAKQSFQA